MRFRGTRALALAAAGLLSLAACSSGGDESPEATEDASLVVYSGREEELIGDLITQFEEESGVDVDVRYGDSAELAVQLLEEGDRSPADVFWAQDAGSLSAVAAQGLFAQQPDEVLEQVPAKYQDADGQWVGTSGRARVIVYDPKEVPADEVPTTVAELTDPKWQGEVGVAPTNASFQAFVTAFRLSEGDEAAKQWLEDLKANDPQIYESNDLIMAAVNDGDIELGLVNHYYLYEYGNEIGQDNVTAKLNFLEAGDPGTLVNVAGVGTLTSASHADAATEFTEYLLSPEGQEYIVDAVGEYPLVDGVKQRAELPPLDSIQGPDVQLDQLEDLEGTLTLLTDTGWI